MSNDRTKYNSTSLINAAENLHFKRFFRIKLDPHLYNLSIEFAPIILTTLGAISVSIRRKFLTAQVSS